MLLAFVGFTNGLLTGRTNPFRTVAVQTRDNLGRVTDQRTTVGGSLALKETVPAWNNLDKVNGVYSERSGAGSWNEYRDYYYDDSARLIYEEFDPSPSSGDDYLLTAYDGPIWGQSATGGIGVRTHTQRGSDAVLLHEVPSVSTFSRVTGENIGGSQLRTVALSGVALGANKVTLTLDGRNITPVHFPGWQDATGNWSANATLAPGLHRLTATATHPSGWVAPAVAHNFTVLPRAESVTNTYDEMGNIATRTWTGGKVQTLTWDPRGRLVKVVQTGVKPFVWTALYDGLDRRIKTTYTPNGGATVTTKSVFDPEVEFLEIAVAINSAWNWKVYGPDISGAYGGLQGLGGLEAVIGSEGITRGIVNDWFGNTAGYVAAPGAAMTWSPAQFLAWGPAPGWSTPPLDGTKPLHELLGYRGLTVDPPGYIQQGLRPYDPQTGRWLSPDPVGHAGSLSLYDYCDNDPLNVFDPDGRFGKGVGYAAKDIAVGAGTMLYNAGGSIGYGALSAVGQRNLANDIYGSQWQGTKSTAAGIGGLVWNTGGSIGYGALSAVGQNSLAQDIYGDQWSGLKQVGTAFSGGSGNTAAYRTGYTAANIAAIVLPVKAANTFRAGSVGEVASVASQARVPASFFTSTRLEVQALQAQGLTRSQAFKQIRSFNAGNADGFAFHFTDVAGATGIIKDAAVNSSLGIAGRGVYAGTTPTPSALLKYGPTPGWALTPSKPVRIPIRITPDLNPVRPMVPFKTQVFRVDSVPLAP